MNVFFIRTKVSVFSFDVCLYVVTQLSDFSWLFHKFLKFSLTKTKNKLRLGNCDRRDKMFTFCEAFNEWCFMYSSLIKGLSCEHSFFQLAFEAWPASVALKFLNCCFIIVSCFLETLFIQTRAT